LRFVIRLPQVHDVHFAVFPELWAKVGDGMKG
jgi:hypothetical protein